MNAINSENLSLTIEGNEVLSDITCQVHEGEFVAVLGPNGAGKSMFLKVLLGLVRPDSGKVTVFGRKPEKVPPEWIGYVPQVKTLDSSFPALAIELVVTGLNHTWQRWISSTAKEAAIAALSEVGAAHLADRPIGALSGGELQRVYLARSFVRKPRLVLLDEPVTGVDTVGEKSFYSLLDDFRHKNKATIIMVTHDWEVATHNACHVMVLNRRLISFGTPAEALCDDCLKRAYGVSITPQTTYCPRNQPDQEDTHV